MRRPGSICIGSPGRMIARSASCRWSGTGWWASTSTTRAQRSCTTRSAGRISTSTAIATSLKSGSPNSSLWSALEDLEILGDLGRLAEHDRGGAVLLVRQPNRVLHKAALQPFSAHHEVHVDPGEHFGIGLGSLRAQLYLAPGHVLPALLENHHYVVRGAAACADEHNLHRPRREVSSAAVGSSVHRNDMIAPGLGKKRHAVAGPSD